MNKSKKSRSVSKQVAPDWQKRGKIISRDMTPEELRNMKPVVFVPFQNQTEQPVIKTPDDAKTTVDKKSRRVDNKS